MASTKDCKNLIAKFCEEDPDWICTELDHELDPAHDDMALNEAYRQANVRIQELAKNPNNWARSSKAKDAQGTIERCFRLKESLCGEDDILGEQMASVSSVVYELADGTLKLNHVEQD